MTNLEYLEKVKKVNDIDVSMDEISDMFDGRINGEEELDFRQTKALEIIAEELIGINYHLKNFEEAIQTFTNENQTAIRVENIGR